jgi:hypothetical protein
MNVLILQLADAVDKEGLRPKLPQDIGGLGPLLEGCWEADPARRPEMAIVVQLLKREKKVVEDFRRTAVLRR